MRGAIRHTESSGYQLYRSECRQSAQKCYTNVKQLGPNNAAKYVNSSHKRKNFGQRQRGRRQADDPYATPVQRCSEHSLGMTVSEAANGHANIWCIVQCVKVRSAKKWMSPSWWRSEQTCCYAARHVAEVIRERADKRQETVLALSTGSTCIGVYKELVRLHEEENLDFSRVRVFGLGEYYPSAPDTLQSCERYLRDRLLDNVNIASDQIHLLDGTVPPTEIDAHCSAYDQAIQRCGGFDLALLSIGKSGQIAFSDPGCQRSEPHTSCLFGP